MAINGIRKFVETVFPGCTRNRRGSVRSRAKRGIARGVEACEQRVLLTVDMNLVEATDSYYDQYSDDYRVHHVSDGQGHTYFAGYDEAHGQEIWMSDGTVAGTRLIMDVVPGPGSSNATLLGIIGSWAYFAAVDSPRGSQVWKTDGTTVVKITDLDGVDFTDSTYTLTVGNKLYFEGHDGVHGWDMWVTDGTTAGTHLVIDLSPPKNGSTADYLTDVNGTLYFVGKDSIGTDAVSRLYKVDPVSDQLTELNSIETNAISSPYRSLINVNGQLYFSLNDGVHGTELWTSDGTAAGTRMVKDINPNGDGFKFAYTAFGSSLAFLGDDGTNGEELWISDGTDAGTIPLTNLVPTEPLNHYLNGTVASVNGKLVFGAFEAADREELWVSDGTPAGTHLLKDISPGANTSYLGTFMSVGNTAYFENFGDLWKTDGTAAGTVLVKAFDGIELGRGGIFGNKVVFQAAVNGVGSYWLTDGTAQGTYSLEGQSSSTPVGSNVFLYDKDLTNGDVELWGSDLTPGGAVPLGVYRKQKMQGTAISNQLMVGNRLYYVSGNTIGVTDGTSGGDTTLETFTAVPSSLQSVGGIVYFNADDGVHGTELWRTDGTVAGTRMVKDINFGTASSSASSVVAGPGGTVLFTADDGSHGQELWRSDGTTTGTVLVKDINPGSGGAGISFLPSTPDGTVYFTADDGVHGTELWTSDGTAAGTVLLQDINSGVTNTTITSLSTNAMQLFYFLATDSTHGTELWVTDGTVAGTFLLKDINPGAGSSAVKVLQSTADGRVYFNADDGVHGSVLWTSNGTSAGTFAIPDSTPGSNGFVVTGGSTLLNGLLYFGIQNHGGNGAEVWKYDPGTNIASLVKGFFPGGTGTAAVYGLQNSVLIQADDGNQVSFWGSNGTQAGTVLVLQIASAELAVSDTPSVQILNGMAFLLTYDAVGLRLWRSDGSVSGTVVLQNFGIDNNFGILKRYAPVNFFVEQGAVYFWQQGKANVGWWDLWRTDGTAAGTVIVKGSFVDPGPAFERRGPHDIFFLSDNSGTIYVKVQDRYQTARWWSLRLVPESVGVYRNGTFYLDGDGSNGWKVTGNTVTDKSFAFGIAGDLPVSGDWNGDGAKSVGVFRNGIWYLDQNGNYKWNGVAGGDVTFSFGTAGDTPITGDWNGDGITDVGVYRNGAFYLDLNGNHKWDAGDASFKFGNAGDKPVTGDWNGDGKTDVGVVRGATWYLDQDGSRKWSAGDVSFSFGNTGDVPVTGDWNADGKTDVGVYRNGYYYLDKDGNRKWTASDVKFGFGSAEDVPVMAGTWNLGAPAVTVASASPALSAAVAVSAAETPAVVVKASESTLVESAVSPEVTKVKKHAHKGRS